MARGVLNRVIGYPTNTSTATIIVSSGYGSHTTHKAIVGEIKTVVITPPAKTGSGTIDTNNDSTVIDITL